jgi:hypothetical protein
MGGREHGCLAVGFVGFCLGRRRLPSACWADGCLLCFLTHSSKPPYYHHHHHHHEPPTWAVVRLGTIKMLQVSKQFTCKNGKCGHTFRVYADFEQGYVLQPPKACPKVRLCTVCDE